MLLPGIGHLMVGAPGSEEILDRQARFLQANLSPVRR
jgi:hypothetical protein